MSGLKAPSSGYLRRYHGLRDFAWQGGYGAFTLRRDDPPIVSGYLREQRRRHDGGDLIAEWERSEEEPQIEGR